MKKGLVLVFILECFLFIFLQSTNEFGTMGHELVAQIASNLLKPEVLNYTQSVILKGSTLSYVSTWADIVRNTAAYRFTYNFHFADLPDEGNAIFSYGRDCPQDICVVGAIANYTNLFKLLVSPRDVSMKFVIHFVGDLHQPLHLGRKGDLGGNLLQVHFFGKKTNLHAVWDDGILHQLMTLDYKGNSTLYLNHLLESIRNDPEMTSSWTNGCLPYSLSSSEISNRSLVCNLTSSTLEDNQGALNNSISLCNTMCISDWARESGALASAVAYAGVFNNDSLGESYYLKTWPVVEKQLMKAGVRLAMLMQFMLVGDLNSEPPALPTPVPRNDQLYFIFILLALPLSLIILLLGIWLAFLLRRFYFASGIIKNDRQLYTPQAPESSVDPVNINSSAAALEDHEVQLPTVDPEDYAKLIDIENN